METTRSETLVLYQTHLTILIIATVTAVQRVDSGLFPILPSNHNYPYILNIYYLQLLYVQDLPAEGRRTPLNFRMMCR